MPPCSAIARRRLITRHTVIHGASQRNRYSSGRPKAVKIATNTTCVAKIFNAIGRPVRDRTAASSGRRFFHPLTKKASRVSLRRSDARVTGYGA